jgi:CHAD domain-containing protein
MLLSASPAKERISRPRRARLNGGMRCDTAFRLAAGGCVDDIATHHKALCAGDPTALHQTRIALTRLRAAISFYSPMVADSEWLRLKSELKWLNGYLGPTRDLDVAIENCQGAAEKRMFRAARIESQRRLNRALKSARYRRWFRDLSDWIGNGPWSTSEDPRSIRERESPTLKYQAGQLRRWHRKLVKKSRGLQGMGKRKLHRLRLAGKRLRYAIEFSEGALPKEDFSRWRAAAKHLRKGQQILGELNDGETRLSLAASLAGSPGSASAREDDVKSLDRKQKSRLLRRAAIVYRKIAD